MTSRPLEQLWCEIEASHKIEQTGWVRRLINPGATVPAYAAVACHGGARSIMIDIPILSMAGLRDLPITGGLSVALVPPLEGVPTGQRSLAVELEDAQFADVFNVFGADLVDGISRCAKVAEAIVLLLRRLAVSYTHLDVYKRQVFRRLRGTKDVKHYYSYIQGEMDEETFRQQPAVAAAFVHANREARCLELGKSDETGIDDEIRAALNGRETWILIGGPPCQAYSLSLIHI